jgi:energy-coupling factor transport system permease protein
LVVLISTFLIGRIAGLLLLLAYIVAVYMMAGLTPRRLLTGTRHLSVFVILILVINGLLVDGERLRLLPVLSQDGLIAGVYYALRVVVLYVTLALFLTVTCQEDMARGLSALLKPIFPRFSRRVALHGFLSLGFLPLFQDELRRVRIAQGFRGGGMDGGLLQRVTGARMLIVPLFVSAIHRSGQLAMAVELRRIDSTIDRILVVGNPGLRDVVFAAVTLSVVAAAIYI